ncbi:MAG: protein-tyrosine phosphatase [Deltaproteobacteria bacterium]|nr:protein-tyrosine phosphatase [Deltaproteobacteria bacterium]
MKRVLFICTHNSARSQMAEGLINHDLAGKLQAFSAGTEPTSVHPLAIAAMSELGIDISRHRSKAIDEFADEKFDFVITLCDHAAESCPIFFGGVQRIHMGFPNPTAVSGSHEEKLTAFRKVRDQIRAQMVEFLSDQKP